jgi:hypothetical protein
VPGAVDQLRYTWAPRGVEGVNRFQIAGMSAGFRSGEAAGALSLARSLCRYDPPRGNDEERPVSFGWADEGPYRVAFQRLALPAGTDRAGNFAAHLLVGSPETLPAAGIAAAFGSPLWWRGITTEERAEIIDGKRDFELPPIELEELTATAPIPDRDEEATMALLHQLLQLPAGERLAISTEGEALAWTLSSVARLLPEALTGLTASTYEGKPTYPFRLLGASSETISQMQNCDLRLPGSLSQGERRTLEALVATEPASDELRAVVSRAGSEAKEDPTGRMWGTALMLVGLEGGGETGARPDDDLLADSEVAGFLARSPQGRTALARWLQTGGAVLRGVKAAGERMEAACREALYMTLGDQYAAAADLRGSAAAVEAMGAAPAKNKVLDRLLEAAKEEKVAATLGPEDAVMVIRRAVERDLDAATIRPMLRGCVPHLARCAAAPSISDPYLATMFEIALPDPSVSRVLAEAVRSRPRFLESVSLEGAEANHCAALLARFDLGTRESALTVLLPLLIASEAEDRVPALVMSLPAASAAQVIIAHSQRLPSSETIDEICDALGAVLLEQREVGIAHRVLDESRSADGALAAALLRRLADGQGGSATVAIETGDLQRAELRRAVRRLALDHARTGARSLGAVEAHWDALGVIFPREDDEMRLKRLLGLGEMPPPPAAGAAVLAWIAGSLLDREPDLVSRLGYLKDDDLETAATTLAETVDPWRFTEAAPFLENASKRARKWWRRLEGQSEKAHDKKD